MNTRFLKLVQWGLALMDLLVINAVYFGTQFILEKQLYISNDVQYSNFIISLNIMWLLVLLMKNIYHELCIASFEQFTRDSIRAYIYFLLLTAIYLFFFRMLMLSRVFIILVMTIIPAILLMNRFIYLFIYQYLQKSDMQVSRIIVIGYNTLSKKLVDYLTEDGINKKVIGFCEEYENINELSKYPILSNVFDAIDTCKKYGANEIYSTIAPEHNDKLYQLIQHADQNCIRFRIVPDLDFFFKRQMHIGYLKEIPVISLRKEPLEDIGNQIKKRFFDIVVSSLVILLLLSWLVPLICILIKLGSKGPIFFVQLRSGKNNSPFRCFKFRSMRVNDQADHLQATSNDERVTGIGRFLRRTNLDEFPQFFNVLMGDMSIVGPRPHMLKHTDQYSRLIGQYMVRQFLKPGITGWAQVNGFRGETKNLEQMQKRVEHDLWYMENWSLMIDLKIIMTTFINMVRGEENVY